MKFAVLALLGVVSAQDETELMGVRYKKKYVDKFINRTMELEKFLDKNEDELEKTFDQMFDTDLIEEFANSDRADQYFKELEAWGNSPLVRFEE